jgi:transcriptional regulator with XRE-family HTH domain
LVKPDLKARALRAASTFRKYKISQAEVAAFVGASQPQVSRILSGSGLRATRLFEDICLYAERLEGGVTAEAVRANDDLVNALRETWDGSASHAKALAIVIRSLAALRAGSSLGASSIAEEL